MIRRIGTNGIRNIKQLSAKNISGEIKNYIGKLSGYTVDIKLNNYNLFSKLLRKGAVGFAESYMDGDFVTKNLSHLLLFAYDNKEEYLSNKSNKSIIKVTWNFIKRIRSHHCWNSYTRYNFSIDCMYNSRENWCN